MSDEKFSIASKMLEDSVRETCDEMSEDEAWQFVSELGEYVIPTEEWMAMYLAKKWPSIIVKLNEIGLK
jgi:hypothetical protein